jgi:hypothetical protein
MVSTEASIDREYLVHHGNLGDFGRFRAAESLRYRRGERVVVRTAEGLELGVVMCEATAGLNRMMPGDPAGELLRRAGSDDEDAAERLRLRSHQLFEDGRRLIAELGLPLELIDVAILLDGQKATLHHVRWAECDERPLVSALSRQYQLTLSLRNLADSATPANGGCGKPDCGQGHGGCTSCSSGGCATGCGSASAEELKAFFAGLRQKMDNGHRTPLL